MVGGTKFVPKLMFKPFKTICPDLPRAKFLKLVACGLPVVHETI